jgi:hypothetical protein
MPAPLIFRTSDVGEVLLNQTLLQVLILLALDLGGEVVFTDDAPREFPKRNSRICSSKSDLPLLSIHE